MPLVRSSKTGLNLAPISAASGSYWWSRWKRRNRSLWHTARMNLMRVAYITADPGVPVFGRKGCSIHVQEVLRAMVNRGATVHLFATNIVVDEVTSRLLSSPGARPSPGAATFTSRPASNSSTVPVLPGVAAPGDGRAPGAADA